MCALTMDKYLGAPVILGMVVFGELSQIFPGSSDAIDMMWACGRFPEGISDVFLLFHSCHG